MTIVGWKYILQPLCGLQNRFWVSRYWHFPNSVQQLKYLQQDTKYFGRRFFQNYGPDTLGLALSIIGKKENYDMLDILLVPYSLHLLLLLVLFLCDKLHSFKIEGFANVHEYACQSVTSVCFIRVYVHFVWMQTLCRYVYCAVHLCTRACRRRSFV